MADSDPAEQTRRSVWASGARRIVNSIQNVDDYVNASTFGRVFRLKGSGHPEEIKDANFSTELRAGLTTFATMSYIIAVNANILAQTGADCKCDPGDDLICQNPDYDACYEEVRLDLITATAALAGLSSILFGFFTNLPVALAPGMGLNAYFTYQVVGVHGTGRVPYGLALTAVFVEGWIFLILALTGMRHWLVKIIPNSVKIASGVGIGLFLTLVGLSHAAGISLISGGRATPLALAGCPEEQLDDHLECTGGIMSSPKMWVGIVCGGILTAFLITYRVKSAFVIGIAFVSILSWPRNTPISYFGFDPQGEGRYQFFKQVVSFHPIKHTLGAQDWNIGGANAANFALALFTFLYVDIIDCTATLYSMARFANKLRDEDKDFPRSTVAYCTDAVCISLGSLLGCSPVTAFIESGAGIVEGGRTGLTAMATGLCFLVSIFFAPILASIPPWATGCTLVLVGALMIRQVQCINWKYIGDSIPAFVTLAFMPFSYSVAYGLIAGLFVYTALNGFVATVMFCSRGTIRPPEYDMKEYWTLTPPGEKPYILQLITRGREWKDKETGDKGHDNALAVESTDSIAIQPMTPRVASSGDKYSARVSSPTPSMSPTPPFRSMY